MRFSTFCRYSFALAAIAVLCGQASAIPFTVGNLVTVRAGDGSAALGSPATAAFLDEYEIDGLLQQTIAMPTADSGLNQQLTLSGTSTSEGALNLSGNGQYLTLGGYDAALGTASITSSTTIGRVAGRVQISSGTVDTSTVMAATADGSVGNIRSVVSNDGTQFWAGTSAGGVRYTTLGATAGSTQISTTVTNIRVVDIESGQLYASSGSGAFKGVNTVGTGLPTTSGQTISLLNGFDPSTGSTASPYSYFFADANTLYVADERSVVSGGGVQKWTQSAGTWTLAYTMGTGTTGVRGLSGGFDVDGNAVLFGTTTSTSANSLVMVWDSENGPLAPLQTIATAPTNTAFRGLVYLPGGLPLPPAPAPPDPPPAPRLPEPGDIVFGLNTAAAGTLELVSGPVSMDGGVRSGTPWTTTARIQSVEFDNYDGQLHNVRGNLLGLDFGGTASMGTGLIYSFGTNGSIPAPAGQMIGNSRPSPDNVGHTGNLTLSRFTSLSVSPENDKIAVMGYDAGTVVVYDYTAGDTLGAGASLSGGRETTPGAIVGTGSTQGTAWRDNNTVISFSAVGDIYETDAATMATTYQRTQATPSIGGNVTALAYNPDISDLVYATYSGFTSATPTTPQQSQNVLYILDPNKDTGSTLDDYALVHEIDLNTSLGTSSAREIALDEDGNLFIGTFGSLIHFITSAALAAGTDNSSVLWYESPTFSQFNGLDIGFGEASGIPGDYNGDGMVDQADYVIWRKDPANYGGDPGGYLTWRANFGEPGGAGAGGGNGAVPEPTGIAMLVIGLAALCLRRRSA